MRRKYPHRPRRMQYPSQQLAAGMQGRRPVNIACGTRHSELIGAKTTDRIGMRMRRTDPLMPLMPRRMLPEPAWWPVDIACGMWHSARMAAHRFSSLN